MAVPGSSIAAIAQLNDFRLVGKRLKEISDFDLGPDCLPTSGEGARVNSWGDQGRGNCLVDAWAIVNHGRNWFYHVGARKSLLVHDDVGGPAAERRLIWPFSKLRKLELQFSNTPEFLFTINVHLLLDDALRYRTTSMGHNKPKNPKFWAVNQHHHEKDKKTRLNENEYAQISNRQQDRNNEFNFFPQPRLAYLLQTISSIFTLLLYFPFEPSISSL